MLPLAAPNRMHDVCPLPHLRHVLEGCVTVLTARFISLVIIDIARGV